jgi:hypothetical protein
LGTTVTNQNFIQEEIQDENFSSSCQLSKIVKIRIYKTIILPVVLYRCEAWSLILRKEHRLRVFQKRVLRRIFGPKRDEEEEEEDQDIRGWIILKWILNTVVWYRPD